MRGETGEVADVLALSEELDRDAGAFLHREHEPALGRAVELGQDEAGDPGVLEERLGLHHAILARRGIEHQQHLADRRLLLDHAADLGELVHEPALGVQASCRVDEHDLGAGLLGVVDRLIGDGCRVLTLLLRTHDRRSAALGPRRELVDGGRTEGVGGAHDDRAAVALQELRELADRGRLADAVDPDDEHDGGALGEAQRRVELREMLFEGLFEHALQVSGIGRAVAVDLLVQLVDDPLGDLGPEIGGQQGRLEVVPRVLVDRGLGEHAAQGTTERPGGFSHAPQPRGDDRRARETEPLRGRGRAPG